jgi:hypothetical protein
LRVGLDFRELFFLPFLLLFFLLAGIGSLETSDVNFVDLQHGFHRPMVAGGSTRRGATSVMDTPGRRKSYQPDGACAVILRAESKPPTCSKSRQGLGTLRYFSA